MWLPKRSRFLYKCWPFFEGLSHTPSPTFYLFGKGWTSYMMKVQGLIVAARSLSGDRRPTFGFDALPFVGVVFFPSSSLVGVMLFPSPAH